MDPIRSLSSKALLATACFATAGQRRIHSDLLAVSFGRLWLRLCHAVSFCLKPLKLGIAGLPICSCQFASIRGFSSDLVVVIRRRAGIVYQSSK